jgi:uncharacterized protein (TIGR03435 family)
MQMNLPDGFTSTNLPLRSIISIVYQVPVYRMSGGPGWIETEPFDITAKADHRLTQIEKFAMIRALLEDRFTLRTHREEREGRIYALVLAHPDGRLGPEIRPSALDCAAILAERQRTGSGAPALDPANPVPECGATMGPRSYRGRGVKVGAMASTMSAMMRETIVDETGLTGWYDMNLSMTIENPPPDNGPPSIFTALQEQLGLKLEPRRGPVETFVIDSAERPVSD